MFNCFMTRVSSITVTLNEEENIGACLDSISWCDEHIVIDEYSSDRTVEIAESKGAKVFQKRKPEQANSFDVLRETAIEEASNEWILRIDADERSHTKLNRRLKSLAGSSGFDVVQVPRMTHIGDEWVKAGFRWWPDSSPILFRRSAMDIGDKIHTSMNPVEDARVIQLPDEPSSSLYHYSYDSLWDLTLRRWRYARIESEVCEKPISNLLYLAASDLVGGLIFYKGLTDGYHGILVPIIDSLYRFAIIFHRDIK
jgi:glycosyltransferase involved in cell wall biosynthesis